MCYCVKFLVKMALGLVMPVDACMCLLGSRLVYQTCVYRKQHINRNVPATPVTYPHSHALLLLRLVMPTEVIGVLGQPTLGL